MLHKMVITPMKTHDLQHSRQVGNLTWAQTTAYREHIWVSYAGMGALGGVWIMHPKAIRPAAVSRSKVADTLSMVLNAEVMMPAFMLSAFSLLQWAATFRAKLEGLGTTLVKHVVSTSEW